MWCRGLESLRAARLARSQTTYRPELNEQRSGNRASTRTVPLRSHVTSRHLSGYYSTDILEAQVVRLGVRQKAPRTYHLKASSTTICTAGAPGARVASNHPTRAGRAGNLKNAWHPGCKGDATGTGERSSMFPTRPHRGRRTPHECITLPAACRRSTITTQRVPSLGITTSNHAAAKSGGEDTR